jgi:starch synthase
MTHKPPTPADPQGLRILVASSEAHPLMKTGGLADVAASLPAALRRMGHDARLIIPAYPRAARRLREPGALCEIRLPDTRTTVRILEGMHPDRDVPVYLVDAPEHFHREGNPYTDLSGRDWGDNAERFLLFSRVVAMIAQGLPALGWYPEVLHGNDWQCGLAPVMMREGPDHPATIFTVHNLAYQGLFDRTTFDRIGLPPSLWTISGLEFHHRMSFIKGGIAFSDRINTVSPTYAREVRTPQYGCGLDGLLRQIGRRFSGIINGIDYADWDPATDHRIFQTYGSETFGLKLENKLEVQRRFGLARDEEAFLLGHVGRLVEQKGVDLILAILPDLLQDPTIQCAVQATGERDMEQALLGLAADYPGRVAINPDYDETGAHCIEAGCDAFLMPSRFEPCGLNQLYSLRYGTPPICRRTGGLADTVVPTTPETLADGTATGFLFDDASPEALREAIWQALGIFRYDRDAWRQISTRGMAQDFSWDASARSYLRLYLEAIAEREHSDSAMSA